LTALYKLPPTDFNDISTGYNGVVSLEPGSASDAKGYNEVTGRGSPIAGLLVDDLASYGIPARTVVASSPTSVVAGNAFQVTVDVVDQTGNVVTNYNGPVTLFVADGPSGSGWPATVNADKGVATFNDLSLTVATGYVLATYSGGLSGGWTVLSVTPAPAYQFAITSEPPSSVVASSTFGLTITAEDRYGNATSYNGNVTLFEGSGPLGALQPVTKPASNGEVTFSGLSMTVARSAYDLDAISGSLLYVGTSLAVKPAAAYHLEVTSQPVSTVLEGQSFGLTITAYDKYGNVATSFDGSVSMSLPSTMGLLGGPPLAGR
jgi:hypothetical protein